jgi:hypothetical protein
MVGLSHRARLDQKHEHFRGIPPDGDGFARPERMAGLAPPRDNGFVDHR